MSDYIKREDAIQAIVGHLVPKQYDGNLVNAGFEVAHEIVDALPSADVVEVVRCKDCIHNDQCKHRVVMWVEDPINTWHKDIDFCSYGERKYDDECK